MLTSPDTPDLIEVKDFTGKVVRHFFISRDGDSQPEVDQLYGLTAIVQSVQEDVD